MPGDYLHANHRDTDIAAAATYPQKEPWTVISRFWDKDIPNINLYFELGPDLSQSLEGTQKLKECVNHVWASAQQRKDTAKERNNTATQASPLILIPFVPAHCEVVRPITDYAWFMDKHLIGQHPLGLYKVWITSTDFILPPAYEFTNLQGFKNNQNLRLKNTSIPLGNWDFETTTTVTPLKINVTRTLKRFPDHAST